MTLEEHRARLAAEMDAHKATIGSGIGPVPEFNQPPERPTVEQSMERLWADRLNTALRSPEIFASVKAAVDYEREQFQRQQAEIQARHTAAMPTLTPEDREKVRRETEEAFYKHYPKR
jgi:hypothetical protein